MTAPEAAKLREWLESRNYAAQTVSTTLVQFQVIRSKMDIDVPPRELALKHRKVTCTRIVAAGDAGAVSAEVRDYAQAMLDVMAEANPRGLRGGRKGHTRKHTARSVPDGDWQRLLAAISATDTPAARVLEVEARTGLRVGDVLRIPGKALHKGIASGVLDLTTKGGRERRLQLVDSGAEEAWVRLAMAVPKSAASVAAGISVSGDTTSQGAAYKQVERQLKALAEELGLDRLHTHRLRRTIAVQALRLTGDLPAVREMLGQAPGSHAVDAYIDEARTEHVAGLGKKIAESFGGKDTK